MRTKPDGRKTLFIDPRFQTSFLSYLTLLSLPVSATFFACYRYLFWNLERQALSAGIAPGNVFFVFVHDQRHAMDFYFLAAFAVVFALLIGFGLHFSNRIAGPIYRVKKHLAEIKRTGEYRPLVFREHDYFSELAEVVNETIKPAETEPASPKASSG